MPRQLAISLISTDHDRAAMRNAIAGRTLPCDLWELVNRSNLPLDRAEDALRDLISQGLVRRLGTAGQNARYLPVHPASRRHWGERAAYRD